MFGVGVCERARTRQSSLVFRSLVHAGIVVAVIVASMLLPGVLPTPRASIIWDGPRLVRLADIPLPPPARKPSAPVASEGAAGAGCCSRRLRAGAGDTPRRKRTSNAGIDPW